MIDIPHLMKNKSVLITGSSRGLGRELALVFAREKYGIILNGRNGIELEKTAGEIRKLGVECCSVLGDIRDRRTLDALYDASKRNDMGVLVNNAGSSLSALKEVANYLSDEQIDEMIETHLSAPIKLVARMLPLLKENKGTIININSLSGLEIKRLRACYCASKWGLRAYTDALRLETADNVRVIGVYPSRIKTIPEFQGYGWEPREVAERIYESFKNIDSTNLVLDGRPTEHRTSR